MTAEQATALVIAVAGLIAAVTALLAQVVKLRQDLNGRMEDLLRSTWEQAHKQGELEGRDFMRRLLGGPDSTPGSLDRE